MKITQLEYKKRRELLVQKMPENSIALIPAARTKIRNRDADYPFRQDSDFYYLTGFNEPDALLVIVATQQGGQALLFCQNKDPVMEVWVGKRVGPAGSVQHYHMDEAYTLDEIDRRLPDLISNKDALCYKQGLDTSFDQQVSSWLHSIRKRQRQGSQLPKQVLELDQWLDEMRLIKSSAEIEVMQKAADISAAAHCRVMQTCKSGWNESQLEAEFLYHCHSAGARFQAYTPIVGGGANACVLHYVENDATLTAGSLVLIDAGCEVDGYASDITRTFPVNGRFDARQKALYEVVLDAQLACIELIKPGVLWGDIHAMSVKKITAGLQRLGILNGDIDDLIEAEAYKPFYMHRIGHWLGLDVHDVGAYMLKGEWRLLQPGMVMTVEPGVYIAEDADSVDACWRGMGIRIEDDILVTESGHHVLTHAVPKSIAAIETLMQ